MSDRDVPRDEVETFLAAMPGVVPTRAWGETSFFYNPGRVLPRGAYFATVKDKDGEHDRASFLDRAGVWRLNIGLPQATFRERFGATPRRPPKGGVIDGPWDFTTTDMPSPHPVYGWMSWVCVLNPSRETWERVCRPWLEAAHTRAAATFRRRGPAAAGAARR